MLLTRWDVATLLEALDDRSLLLSVLTNTRAMEARRPAAVTREVCLNLKLALAQGAQEGRAVNPILVRRSDSTLRGPYPIETDVMAEDLGPFDAHCLTPAFFGGGRITVDGVHDQMVHGKPVPVHETELPVTRCLATTLAICRCTWKQVYSRLARLDVRAAA